MFERCEYQRKKNVESNQITIAECVFLAYFLCIFGARAIGLYEGMTLYNISLVAGMLLFGLKIIVTKHSVLEYGLIGSLTLLALVVYINTGEKGFLIYVTMFLGMKHVSVRRVFKIGALILSIAFIAITGLSLLRINEEIFYVQDRVGMGSVFRHALGYPHPNTLHTTYVVLVALLVYLIGKQTKKVLFITYALLFFVSAYLYLYSGSRTGLLISGLYLLINFYFQSHNKLYKVEKWIVYAVYPLCMIFSIILPVVLNGKMFETINKVLNNRWEFSVYYMENEPITLFGTRFKETPSTFYMIDSSFLYSFLQLGIVACVIIMLLNMITIHEFLKKDMISELALMVSFYIMGITDPFLYNLSTKNLVFIFIGSVFYQYITKAEKYVPDILLYPIQILKIGDKEVKYIALPRFEICITRKQFFRLFFIFCGAAAVFSGVYLSKTSVPQKMYINENDLKYTLKHLDITKDEWWIPETYLSEEEVQTLRAEGNIVKDYLGEDSPMFFFEGDAPRMEYIRNVASIGFWSGFFATVFFWIFKYTMRRKSNGIE